MAVYLIRWQNGSITFVDAASKQDAIEMADEFGSVSPKCHIEKVKHFMLDFDVKFDEEPQPEVASMFPGAGIGGRLHGPIATSEFCMEQIDHQIFACKEAQDKWKEVENGQASSEDD